MKYRNEIMNFQDRMPLYLRIIMTLVLFIILAHCKKVLADEIDQVDEILIDSEELENQENSDDGQENPEEELHLDPDTDVDVFEIPLEDAASYQESYKKPDGFVGEEKENSEEDIFYSDISKSGDLVYQNEDSVGGNREETIEEENPGNPSVNEASVTAEESLVQLVTIIPFCTGIISGMLFFRYFLF